jgi:hypothetical protein
VGLPDSGDRPVAASSHEVEDTAESVRVTAAGLELYRGDGAASVSANGRFI